MGNWCYSLRPINGLATTNYSAGEVNVHGLYNSYNALILSRPRRIAQANDVTCTFAWDFTITSSMRTYFAAVTAEMFTFPSWSTFSTSGDGSAWQVISGAVDASGTKAGATDSTSGRTKILLTNSVQFAPAMRYARVQATSFYPEDGIPQVGNVALWRNLVELNRGVDLPVRMEVVQPDSQESFLVGGVAVKAAPIPRVKLTLTLEYHTSDTLVRSQVLALAQVPPQKVILLYENNGDIKRFWHVQRLSSTQISIPRSMYETWQCEFLEVA